MDRSDLLSPSEKLVFVLAIICGLFVHFYDLNLLSGWTDELASIFYADHLSVIYSDETHPPLFYLFLKPFVLMFDKNLAALRAVVGATSLSLLVWACVICKKIYGTRGALILGILLCFSPVELVHARMIRQYSVFFELTAILILYSLLAEERLTMKGIVAFILVGIHPIGFFPVAALGLYQVYLHRKLTKESVLYFALCGLVFLYYVSKMFILPGKQYLTGYLPHRDFNFYVDVMKTMAGEHFPKINYHPIPLWFAIGNLILVLMLIGFAVWKKNLKTAMVVVFIGGFSLASAEIISLVMVNIKLGRYYGFLLAPVLILAVHLFHRNKFAVPLSFVIGLLTVTVINPLYFYPGEREVLGKDFDFEKSVLCANKYQFYYYFDRDELACLERFKYFLEKKQDFVYVDLNGYGRENLIYYSQFFDITDYYYHGMSFRAKAIYRGQK